jgi:hypothetical protein
VLSRGGGSAKGRKEREEGQVWDGLSGRVSRGDGLVRRTQGGGDALEVDVPP